MKRFLAWVALGLVVGCGGSQETPTEPATPPPQYELHEWGVITTSAAGTTVTAGPTRSAAQIAVEKPVLYFHTAAPVDVQLEVLLGPGFELREHYPPTQGLHWSATLMPDGCPGQHAYPARCDAADGVCEVGELSRYEARDAACLHVGDQRLPLLFYRLGATRPVSFPANVEVHGGEVRAHATRGEVTGWRVAFVDGEVRAAPFTLGQTWQPLATPTQPWTAAAESLSASLNAIGLTGAERAAFQRAWWPELFGAAAPAGPAADADPMDEDALPEAPRAIVEEQEESARMAAPGADVLDVFFYLLPADEVERVAQLAATPTPTRVARAFLVRHVL
jgi:hypothetical protein